MLGHVAVSHSAATLHVQLGAVDSRVARDIDYASYYYSAAGVEPLQLSGGVDNFVVPPASFAVNWGKVVIVIVE